MLENKPKHRNCHKMLLAVVSYFSYLKTLFWFYILRKFRNLNYDHISFIEKSYQPTIIRDKKLLKTILDFNRKRLENNG